MSERKGREGKKEGGRDGERAGTGVEGGTREERRSRGRGEEGEGKGRGRAGRCEL